MLINANKKALVPLVKLALESEVVEITPHTDSLLAVVDEETKLPSERLVAGQTALEAYSLTTAEGANAEVADKAIEDYAILIGNGMMDQMAFARHVARPAIRTVVTETLENVKKANVPEYTIEQVYLAEVHDNPSIFELMSEFSEVGGKATIIPVGVPMKEEADILAMCRIGSTTIDKQLADMIATYPEGWLTSVYATWFCSTSQEKIALSSDMDKLDEYLIIYILANYHEMNPDPEIEQMYPNRDNESVFMALKQQAAVALLNTHRAWDTLKSAGHLVLSYPISSWFPKSAENAVIRVIGDNYEPFLHAGGLPEMIIGSCVSNRVYTSTKILELAEELTHRYVTYNEACDRHIAENVGTIVRESATKAVEALLEREDTGLTLEVLADHNEKAELITRFIEAISLFKDSELVESAYTCIRIAFCNALIPDTSAREILSRIDAYMEKYEGIDGRMAGYHVAADLIVEHLTEQCAVRR